MNLGRYLSKNCFSLLSLVFIISTFCGLTPLYGSLPDPRIKDPNLRFETLIEGLEYPTSMAFLGPDDILVLEKNNGKVRRVVNNTLLLEPLLDLKVSNEWERGLLGIAVAKADLKDHNGTGTNKDSKNNDQTNRGFSNEIVIVIAINTASMKNSAPCFTNIT